MTQVIVMGHSGYAERGKDIVCAGVSALTQAYVMEMDASDCKRIIIDDGVMDVIILDNYENDIRLSFLEKGLGEIEKQYPNNVSIHKNKKIY